MKTIHITKKETCEKHKPHKLGMLEWYSWVDELEKKGFKQKQCEVCGYWFYPEEM